MRRVRWLGAQWPISIRTLAARMKGQLFVTDSLDGFVIERVRDTSIEAHYVEKLIYEETITDPFGQETTYERIGYRQIDFSLHSEFPNIELRDSHRSTRAFISKILELCDFSVSIEPLSVDLLGWASRFEIEHESPVTIDSLQVSGVTVTPGVQATMLLKGDADVRPALGILASQGKFNLEKLQIRIPVSNRSVRVHLSSSASARIPEECWNDLLPTLRKSLAAQKNEE